MPDRLQEADLLAKANELGCEISPRQLKRYRLAGLMYPPNWEHPEGTRGSNSWYPPEALDQLLAICRIRKGERRLDEQGFWLWWEGGWVHPPVIRRILVSLCSEGSSDLSEVAEGRADPLDAAEHAAGVARSSRSPIVRELRRRVGRREEDLDAAVVALIQLILGDEPAWETPDVGLDAGDAESSVEDILRKMVGIDRATTDKPEGIGPLLDSEPDVRALLSEFSLGGASSPRMMARSIQTTSDTELAQAREDARVMAEDFPVFVEAAESLFGRNVLGLGIFRLFQRRGRHALTWRAGLVAIFLQLRKATPSDQIDEVLSAMQEAAERGRELLQFRKQEGKEKEDIQETPSIGE